MSTTDIALRADASRKTEHAAQPAISIVIEGYNQSQDLGTADDTIAALEAQDFPTEQMEIILVGSASQTADWERRYTLGTRFYAVKTVSLDAANYYALKNCGGEIALGPIIAFTDSDVRPKPTWVSAIVGGIGGGADVVLGPSLFRQTGGLSADSPLMRVLASITWGWIMGKRQPNGLPRANGFMDHNVALRAQAFRDHQYRTEFGRIIASPLLYRALANAGLRIAVQPAQQAAHHFTWRYWLFSLHFRYGNEVYRLRRLDPDYPNKWIARTWVLEPVVTMGWHMMLDMVRWFRFAGVLGAGKCYQAALLPLVVLLSAIARSAEMCGMAATMFAPERMRRWAETV